MSFNCHLPQNVSNTTCFRTFRRRCSWTLGYSSPFRKWSSGLCLAPCCFFGCQRGGSGRSAVSWQRRRAQIVSDLLWNQMIAMELIQSIQEHSPSLLVLALLLNLLKRKYPAEHEDRYTKCSFARFTWVSPSSMASIPWSLTIRRN